MSSSLWFSTQKRFPGLIIYPCRWSNMVLWLPISGKWWTATRWILNKKEKASFMKITRVQYNLCIAPFDLLLEKENESERVLKVTKLIMQYKNTRTDSKDKGFSERQVGNIYGDVSNFGKALWEQLYFGYH